MDKINNIVIRTILWILVVLWMGVIFSFSAENAEESLNTSDSIVDVVVEGILETQKEAMSISEYESFKMKVSHFVRKSAHFTAYMLLGILTLSALLTHKMKNTTRIFLTVVVCFLYAVSDEIHQIFVPGRAGRFSDVMIDTSGALLGILLVLGVICLKQYFKNKNLSKSKKGT